MNKTSIGYLIAAFIVLVIAIFLPAGCNGKDGPGSRVVKKDTTITLAAFLGYQLKNKHWGPARRIAWDSLMIKWDKDSSDPQPVWEKYRIYEAEIPIQVDSAFNKIFGDPVLDSLGRPNVVKKLMIIPSQYVVDTIYDLDSAFRYLDRFLVKDSINK